MIYLDGRTTEKEAAELANYIGIGTHGAYQQLPSRAGQLRYSVFLRMMRNRLLE